MDCIALIKMIVQSILIQEMSKVNNVNYIVKLNGLVCILSTNTLIQKLIDICDCFEAGIGEEYRIDYLKDRNIWLSYDHIWSKIEDDAEIGYFDIQFYVRYILEEGIKLKNGNVISLKESTIPQQYSWNPELKVENKCSIKK